MTARQLRVLEVFLERAARGDIAVSVRQQAPHGTCPTIIVATARTCSVRAQAPVRARGARRGLSMTIEHRTEVYRPARASGVPGPEVWVPSRHVMAARRKDLRSSPCPQP